MSRLSRESWVNLQIDDTTFQNPPDEINRQTGRERVWRCRGLHIRRRRGLQEDRLLRHTPDLNGHGRFRERYRGVIRTQFSTLRERPDRRCNVGEPQNESIVEKRAAESGRCNPNRCRTNISCQRERGSILPKRIAPIDSAEKIVVLGDLDNLGVNLNLILLAIPDTDLLH